MDNYVKDLIIVSKALRLKEAKEFQKKTRDLFRGKLIPAKRTYKNGHGGDYQMYYVARQN